MNARIVGADEDDHHQMIACNKWTCSVSFVRVPTCSTYRFCFLFYKYAIRVWLSVNTCSEMRAMKQSLVAMKRILTDMQQRVSVIRLCEKITFLYGYMRYNENVMSWAHTCVASCVCDVGATPSNWCRRCDASQMHVCLNGVTHANLLNMQV